MKTVYCVEDDNNIRELVFYTLTQTGSTAVGFADAESFFAAVAERLPDLVLLDIMLPDKDGMEILHELRSNARTERLPIIMVTAKSGQIDKIKGLDGGADDYITKPFDIMELLAENRGKVLTRDTLMNRVWGTEFEGESRTVDVHIRTLRQKLGEAAEYIETVRNVGYKLS